MADLMETIVRHILKTGYEDLPSEAVAYAKKSILDTMGVIIAGSSEEGCGRLVEYVLDWGGRPDCTIPVFGVKAPAPLSALVCGAMARAKELDDVHDGYPLHVTASILPLSMTLAEHVGGIDGKAFIAAVAVGQDVTVRMALANRQSPIESGRYNLQQVLGYAALSAKLLGVSEETALNAVGISYGKMSADFQALLDGPMSAFIQQGNFAKAAIESTFMAQKGITGTRNVLQGQYGFFHSYEPEPDLDVMTSDLGSTFKGPELSTKFHSSCRQTHEAIDLVQAFLADGVKPRDIEQITIRCTEQAFKLVGGPVAMRQNPNSAVDAMFSMPFTVAAAFYRGDFFIDEMEEDALRDPDIRDLARRITPVIDDPVRLSDINLGSTLMEITLGDGSTLSKEIHYPIGNPRNPVTMEDCVFKFRKCVQYALKPFSERRLNNMIEMVQDLEKLEDVTKLFELMVPNAGARRVSADN